MFFNTIVQLCGSKRTPFTPESFELVVNGVLEKGEGPHVPAFSTYAKEFRERFREKVWVKDNPDLEKSVFEYRLSCPVAHPKLCFTRDSAIMPFVRHAAKVVRNLFSGSDTSTWHTSVAPALKSRFSQVRRCTIQVSCVP